MGDERGGKKGEEKKLEALYAVLAWFFLMTILYLRSKRHSNQLEPDYSAQRFVLQLHLGAPSMIIIDVGTVNLRHERTLGTHKKKFIV